MIRSGDSFDFHFDRDNNSIRKGKIITASVMVFCVLIFVAVVVRFILFQREMTGLIEEEKQAAVLHAAGLMKSEIQDEKSIEVLYHYHIIQHHVSLDSGELVAGSSVDTARQKCEKLVPERDPAQARQRCTVMGMFFVRDKNNEIQQVIIPVTGKGAKSTMHVFFTLGLDGRAVRNLCYYQQRETPFLEARVEDVNRRKQWPGKRLLDSSGHPTLKIVQDKPEHADKYTVDGISGATLTLIGVEKGINYWMEPQGYGQFLQCLASDRNNFNP